MVCIAMSWFLLMTGCFTFIAYASIIFEESNTTLDPHIAAIILAVVQIFGGLISTSIGDTFGRKTILTISLFGSAVGLFSMALYMYLSVNGWNLQNYGTLPVVFLAFVILISNAGIVPISNVAAVENLPATVRNNKLYDRFFSCQFTIFDHFFLQILFFLDSDVGHDFLHNLVQFCSIFG